MPWPLPESSVLGLFAKQPIAGRVKTRLIPALGAERAAQVAETLMLDAVEQWGGSEILAEGGRRVLVYDPPEAGPWFDARVPASFALQPQVEGDLGARMAGFIAGEFAEGAKRVVVIGCDSPTLDASFVVSAFLLLEYKDVVLGPATDGGYYLVGCQPPVPPIFGEGIDWSTPDVLAQTVERLERSGRSLAVLPPWYDVDTADDLRMLAGHLRARRLAGMDPAMTRIEKLLRPESE